MTGGVLEVIAIGPPDARAAEDGGADRLEVVTAMQSDGLSPEPDLIERIRRRTTLPMRVMLRLTEDFSITGADLGRLTALARSYASAGADGVVFGFLTRTLEIDEHAVRELAGQLSGMPWTFHRAVDHTLDQDHSWQTLHRLAADTGLDTVLTAGSVRGVGTGLEDLAARASADARAAGRMMAGGGLDPEHVPWLAQAGVRAFHVGSAVRPDASWKAYVDAKYVRSWRTLIDEEVARAAF